MADRIFEVVSAGGSKFLMYLSIFVSRIIMNVIIMHYMGNNGLSVFAMCNSLIFFATCLNNGSANAFMPIVGSLYGEKDFFGIRQCVRSSFIFVLCANTVLFSLLMFCPRYVTAMFGLRSQTIIKMAVTALKLLAIAVPFKGINSVLQALYNTTEYNRLASLISILSGVAYTALYAFVIPMIAPSLVWLAFGCSEFSTFLTVMIIAGIIKKNKGVSDFLLLKPLPQHIKIEGFTLEATEKSAAGLAAQIFKICMSMGLERSVSNKISMAVEEMTVAAASSANKAKIPLLDIMMIKYENEVILSFRENGRPCNLLYNDPEHSRDLGDGIDVFIKIATSTEYSHQLGFNTIIAKFENPNERLS